jgi:hypothetical protein
MCLNVHVCIVTQNLMAHKNPSYPISHCLPTSAMQCDQARSTVESNMHHGMPRHRSSFAPCIYSASCEAPPYLERLTFSNTKSSMRYRTVQPPILSSVVLGRLVNL